MKHRSIVTGVVALLACIGSSVLTAQAAPSTINFTGQILAEPLFGTPTTTATVAGSYIFETSTPDSSADPAIGIYHGAITALSFTVDGKNGAHPGLSNSGDITVRNPNPGPLNDNYEVTSNVSGPTVASITPIKFSFFVEGFPFSTPLIGKGLPTSLPPGGFESDSLNITFLNSAFPGDVFTTQGVIFFPPVPEPSSVLLLGSGVVWLRWWRNKVKAVGGIHMIPMGKRLDPPVVDKVGGEPAMSEPATEGP